MDRSVKITTSQPDGDANGLNDPDVIRQLFDDPERMRVGIVLFNMPKSSIDRDKGVDVGGVVFRRIEVVMDDRLGDASALERLLTRAYERRTGETTLDAELEEDVRAAFDNLRLDDDGDDEKIPPDREQRGGDGSRFGDDE